MICGIKRFDIRSKLKRNLIRPIKQSNQTKQIAILLSKSNALLPKSSLKSGTKWVIPEASIPKNKIKVILRLLTSKGKSQLVFGK